MSNSKLIIIEGAQGAGKTTYTDYIRHTLSYTNLYRLSGTADTTKSGLLKAKNMYDNLLKYMESLENNSINLVFDRTFFTEEVYCRLGKKEYSFTEVYNNLLEKFSKLDFEIYYITLFLENEKVYEERLNRNGKAVFEASKFSIDNSIGQQKEYLKLADEIKEMYPNINVINIRTDRPKEDVEKKIREVLDY